MTTTRALCRYCGTKPARKTSYFCCNWCGNAQAEEASQDHAWCPQCADWVYTGRGFYCEHYTGSVASDYRWPAPPSQEGAAS